MGKVEPIRPLEAPPSSTLRENLAGLIEAAQKAERVKADSQIELSGAFCKKREAEGRLKLAEEQLNDVLAFYDEQSKTPAEKAQGWQHRPEPKQGMGGQYWDLRRNQDADWNYDPENPTGIQEPEPKLTMKDIAALPPLDQLRDAVRMAFNESYAASIRIGVLEGIKDEAERVSKRAEAAVDEAVKAILRAELAPTLMRKASAIYEEFVPTIIALNQLGVLLEDRFGRPDPVQKQIAAFISNMFGGSAFRNLESAPAAVALRHAVEQLHINPNTPLPE